MTISHHPPEDLLADFVMGALDEAEHLVLAVHASQCPSCRRFIDAIEHLAGTSLETAEPVEMKEGAFNAVMARIGASASPLPTPEPTAEAAFGELPQILRSCRFGRARRVAPGVRLQPILLPECGGSRAFLLWSAAGTRMLEHSHTGTELTCVLKGSFSHQGGVFGPGDFDFGDDAVDHQPMVGSTEPCLCLVAMAGDLQLRGFLGRLISPFVHL